MTSANTDFIQVVTCAGIGNGAELTEPHNQLSVSVYHSWRGTNRRVWITGAPRDKAHLRSQGKIASGRRPWNPTLQNEAWDSWLSERLFVGACLRESVSSSVHISPRARPLGAVRRAFMSPSPVAFPARFLKNLVAVSTTPTFSATAAAIHWFNDTPFSFASR